MLGIEELRAVKRATSSVVAVLRACEGRKLLREARGNNATYLKLAVSQMYGKALSAC